MDKIKPGNLKTTQILESCTCQYRVIYADTDMAGVVYHARYLEYLERGRTELLRKSGNSYKKLQEAGVILPVVECQVRFFHSAQYDDLLTINSRIARLHKRGMDFSYLVTREETKIVTGITRHLYLGANGKVLILPDLFKIDS
ncbi:acyl-CoA thioesterase [Candidatus Riflebacteria bacterium]